MTILPKESIDLMQSLQTTSGIASWNEENILNVYGNTKDPEPFWNLEKKNRTRKITLPDFRLYPETSHQKHMVIAQKQTQKSVE